MAVRTVVVSTQHAERIGRRELRQSTIRQTVVDEVIKPVLGHVIDLLAGNTRHTDD